MAKVKGAPSVQRYEPAGIGLGRRIRNEQKTREAVERSTQWDSLYETTNDSHRCGPSAIVAGAALAGNNQLLGLLAGLQRQRNNPDYPEQLDGKLTAIQRRLDAGDVLEASDLQIMADALHSVGQADGDPEGSTSEDLVRMLAIAGFHGRPARTLLTNAPTKEQRYAEASALLREMDRGEMALLLVPSRRIRGGYHVVLAGRSNDDRYFVYDSSSPDPKNCLRVSSDDSDERRHAGELLGNAMGVMGVSGHYPIGVIFSASPLPMGGASWRIDG